MHWYDSKILMSTIVATVFAGAVVALEATGHGSEAAYGVLCTIGGVVLGRISQPFGGKS